MGRTVVRKEGRAGEGVTEARGCGGRGKKTVLGEGMHQDHLTARAWPWPVLVWVGRAGALRGSQRPVQVRV